MPYKDPEKAREYSRNYHRQWYRDHKELISERRKDYRKRDPEKYRAHYEKWRAKNPHYFVARLYGITVEEYQELVTKQDRKCALCGKRRPLHIDHDHATGRIRGLLCRGCNVGLGHLGDSVEGLQRAIAYLCPPSPSF